MKILAVETSCDETAAAVTEDLNVLSSVKITQEVHKAWGGVVPSLAKRDHEANIDWVIEQALVNAGFPIESGMTQIGAIAVTQGPGLAIALGVGIAKARDLSEKYNKPLVAVNHVEGHILSALVSAEKSNTQNQKSKQVSFPCLALVISGGHTQIILVKEIGKYKILAQSLDDDIGEALDKGARALGLGWPGGAVLEERAKLGNPKKYILPMPMARRTTNAFSYSGLKAALIRVVAQLTSCAVDGKLSEEQVNDLAAAYQERVFEHIVRVLKRILNDDLGLVINDLLVGGGVAANQSLKSKIQSVCDDQNVRLHYPENMVLCTDNAAMIGVVGGFKAAKGEFVKPAELDRKPRWSVESL